MRYREYPTQSQFSDYIESCWTFSTDDNDPDQIDHVIVPDGTASISSVLLPNGDRMVGLTTPARVAHQVQIAKGALYGGIRLRPGRAGAVLHNDMQSIPPGFHSLAEFSYDLAEAVDTQISKARSSTELAASLEKACDAVISASGLLDQHVCAMADAIIDSDGDISIAAASASIPISERQLRRRFLRQTGLTAKELARLRRVRRSCIQLVEKHGAGLGDASLEAGFADQAHMAREFKSVFGASTQMIAQYLQQIRHENLVTARQ